MPPKIIKKIYNKEKKENKINEEIEMNEKKILSSQQIMLSPQQKILSWILEYCFSKKLLYIISGK